MKKEISKILLYLTLLVLLVGMGMYHFVQWYGFIILILFGQFLSPLIIVVLLIKKIFFHTENNNKLFYLNIIINLALISWSLYVNYHFYDNFNIML